MNRWALTEQDLENAHTLLQEELIPLDEKSMFCAGLYCILSASEKYERHTKIYGQLLDSKLDSPGRIKSNRQGLSEIVKRTRFPSVKEKRIYDFALWWPEARIARKILEDVNAGRKDEFVLRNLIADEAPGIGHKGASLFMIKCGYENVVPIDIWMVRFLKDQGYDIQIPDYEIQSGPKPKEYLIFEQEVIKIARGQNITPALLQFALWSKHSTWNNK